MLSNTNYDAQKDEIELLHNILFEKLHITKEFPNFELEISIKPDISDTPKLNILLYISLQDEYPNMLPHIGINDQSSYLASSKIKSIHEKIRQLGEEYLGLPMIYQIYELIQAFANEQENILNNETFLSQKALEDEKKKQICKINLEENLLETKTYTPVAKEAFEVWYKNFYAEVYKNKSKNLVDQEKRLSGREFFMMRNVKSTEEVEEEGEDDVQVEEEIEENKEKVENAMYFDAEAFEEDIENIDFEQEGVGDA